MVRAVLNLTLLAPDITEAILDGRQPKGLALDDAVKAKPLDWREQRRFLGLA